MLTFTKAIEELDHPDIVLDDDDLPSDVATPTEGTIWLIRHASTEMNAHNGQGDRIRGWRDVPLSEQGYVEADDLADKMKDSGINLLIYSDFARSRDTAEAVARTTGAEMIACSDFRPWNVGNFTGRNSNDAHPELVQYAIEAPECPLPGGESFDCFRERVFDGLRHLFARFADRKVGIVTHHRVERLIQAWIKAGMSPTLDIDLDTMFAMGEAPASAEEVTIDVAALGPVCNPQEQEPLGLDKNLTLGDVHQPTSLKTVSQSSGRLVKPKRSLRDKIAELKASGKVPMSDDDEHEKEHATGGTSVNESTSQVLSWPTPADHQWAHDGSMEMPRSHGSENAALGTREKVVKDETEWRVPLDVVKADSDKMWVFGWASIVEADGRLIEDKQGDIIPPEEIEKAAYEFVLYSRSQGDMHERKGVGRLIESMVFTLEKQEVLGVRLGLQGWWLGFKVDDEKLWSEIKSGAKPEFSIGGKGIRTPV